MEKIDMEKYVTKERLSINVSITFLITYMSKFPRKIAKFKYNY